MNGNDTYMSELATLKAQLDEAQSLVKARTRHAGKMSGRLLKAKQAVDQCKASGLHDWKHWPEIADLSVVNAEARFALEELALAFDHLSWASERVAKHIQAGIRQGYYQ